MGVTLTGVVLYCSFSGLGLLTTAAVHRMRSRAGWCWRATACCTSASWPACVALPSCSAIYLADQASALARRVARHRGAGARVRHPRRHRAAGLDGLEPGDLRQPARLPERRIRQAVQLGEQRRDGRRITCGSRCGPTRSRPWTPSPCRWRSSGVLALAVYLWRTRLSPRVAAGALAAGHVPDVRRHAVQGPAPAARVRVLPQLLQRAVRPGHAAADLPGDRVRGGRGRAARAAPLVVARCARCRRWR